MVFRRLERGEDLVLGLEIYIIWAFTQSSVVFLVPLGWLHDFGLGMDFLGTGVCFYFFYILLLLFWSRVLD